MANSTHIPLKSLEENQRPLMAGTTAMFTVLVTIVVALRFLSRRLGKIAWKWDDLFISLAYIVFLGLIAISITGTIYAGGQHAAYLFMTDPAKIIIVLKLYLAAPLIYMAGVCLSKLAILSIYLDIFSPVTQKSLRIMCWICIGITVANWFANTIATFKACTPLSYLWNQISAPGTGTCFDINAWFRWASFPNIVTDIVMLILPIPIVIQLQARVAIRVGVAITFLLGSSGLVASICRFAFFYQTDAVTDSTWDAVVLMIWTQMEVGMYIIAASLLAYRPLLKYLGFKVRMRRVGNSFQQPDAKINRDPSSSEFSRSSKESG